MCSSDITPLSWQWVEEEQQAKVFAEVVHMCRDFDAIWEWGKQHHVKTFDRFVKGEDEL